MNFRLTIRGVFIVVSIFLSHFCIAQVDFDLNTDSSKCYVFDQANWKKDNFTFFKYNSDGKLDRVITRFFTFQGVLASFSTEQYYYNNFGKLSVRTEIDSSSNLQEIVSWIDSFFYCNNQLCYSLEYFKQDPGASFELKVRKDYFYNNDQLDSTLFQYYNPVSTFKEIYHYNPSNQLAKEEGFHYNNGSWSLSSIEEYEYNKGKLQTLTTSEVENEIVTSRSKIEFELDPEDHYIKANLYIEDDNEWFHVFYCDLFERKITIKVQDYFKSNNKLGTIGDLIYLNVDESNTSSHYNWQFFDLQGKLVYNLENTEAYCKIPENVGSSYLVRVSRNSNENYTQLMIR